MELPIEPGRNFGMIVRGTNFGRDELITYDLQSASFNNTT